jgi:hypothetical protein
MKLLFKKSDMLIAVVIFMCLLIQPFAWAQKPVTINNKSIKKSPVQKQITDSKHKVRRKPSVQVVNNSGQTIYQVKVGNVLFSRHIGTCSDGCSTGFKNVTAGNNTISVRVEPTSSWVVMGTLKGFEDNNHYAVNLIAGSRDSEGCAELYIRYNTTPYFNDDRTKEKIGKICKIFPDEASKNPPETQVVNNSGVNIHEVKVGRVSFSRHIGSCSDGCSTGFKKINFGSNIISVKVRPASPWVTIGTLNGFEYNKHYAVNFVVNRPGFLCAELHKHNNTSIVFNENHVKEYKSNICKRFITPIPID